MMIHVSIESDGFLEASYSPLFFHPYVKGSQIFMDEFFCTVSRMDTFHDGIVFSNRPVELYEKVTLKILLDDQKWQGGLRVGFTWKNPCLRFGPLPPFVCPDLVIEGKTCAGVVPDEYIAEGNIISFWVDGQGCVFCSINLEAERSLLFKGVPVQSPLWAIVDVYGRTKAVQLLSQHHDVPLLPYRLLLQLLLEDFQDQRPLPSLSGEGEENPPDLHFGRERGPAKLVVKIRE
ncbi:hypothetical protein Chor_002218 [Crotalus horridus]